MVKEVYYAYTSEDANKHMRDGWVVVEYKVLNDRDMLFSIIAIMEREVKPEEAK